MYDLNMTEQQDYILGNYIIQQALKSAVLRDELLVQVGAPDLAMSVSYNQPLLNYLQAPQTDESHSDIENLQKQICLIFLFAFRYPFSLCSIEDTAYITG